MKWSSAVKRYIILFVVAKDRPGIVDDVSTFLFERGANIEDSRMATMGGRFSMMILFSSQPAELETIKRDLDELNRLGFEVSVHEAEDPTAIPRRKAELPLKIEVMSMDHPGIVQKVVHVLHENNVNIQSLNTQVTQAPLSGAPLFDLTLEAGVPAEESIIRVKEELTELATDMDLDLSFIK
jgi:glycine cleavage system transcriptional repressor